MKMKKLDAVIKKVFAKYASSQSSRIYTGNRQIKSKSLQKTKIEILTCECFV